MTSVEWRGNVTEKGLATVGLYHTHHNAERNAPKARSTRYHKVARDARKNKHNLATEKYPQGFPPCVLKIFHKQPNCHNCHLAKGSKSESSKSKRSKGINGHAAPNEYFSTFKKRLILERSFYTCRVRICFVPGTEVSLQEDSGSTRPAGQTEEAPSLSFQKSPRKSDTHPIKRGRSTWHGHCTPSSEGHFRTL